MREFIRAHRPLLTMLITVALAATVAYALSAAMVGRPPIIRDSFNYNTSAMRILNTGTYRYDVEVPADVTSEVEPSAFTTPGYSLFLSKMYTLLPHGGTTPDKVIFELLNAQPWIIAGQLVLAVLTAVAIAYAGYRLGGLPVGWTAGLMAVGYIPFGYNATVALTETLALFLMAIMVVAVVALLAKKEPLSPRAEVAWMAVFGVAAGAHVITRGSVTLWLVVPFMAWVATNRGRMRRALVVAAVGLACVALVWGPWIARNYSVYGSFLPLTSSASTPLLDSVGGAVFSEEEEAIRVSAEKSGEDPNTAVAMFRLKTRWNASPAEFLSWKATTLWEGVSDAVNLPTDTLWDMQTTGDYAPNTVADSGRFLPITSDAFYNAVFGIVRWYHLALMALALVGIALGWRRRAAWVLFSIPAYYALVHTAILFRTRYFYPATVAIILLAAYGAVGGWLLVQERAASYRDSLADNGEVA